MKVTRVSTDDVALFPFRVKVKVSRFSLKMTAYIPKRLVLTSTNRHSCQHNIYLVNIQYWSPEYHY